MLVPKTFFYQLWVLFVVVNLGCRQLTPDEDEEFAGGRAGTVFIKSADAFGQPLPDLTHDEIRRFQIGNSLNRNNWVAAPASTAARDGLGPLFNASACAGCHARDGRGVPFNSAGQPTQSLLFRLSVTDEEGNARPDPVYGGQLQHQSIAGAQPEGTIKVSYTELPGQYADGTPYRLRKPRYAIENPGYGDFHEKLMLSPRLAPHMAGVGLLDAIDEETILENADPEDQNNDGISGRPNYVVDQRSGKKALGRFGWKANEPNAEQQIAAAFVHDIGITSSVFPQHAMSETQSKRYAHLPNGGTPELEDEQLAHVVFYIRTLAVPARRNWDDAGVLKGKALFTQAGCSGCHLPSLKTGLDASPSYLANQTIHPYTDLLLHDMGEGLSDGRPDGEAGGSEWRTAPLWGIGLQNVVNKHTYFLHDGRARNLEEAILWHGGEAEKAKNNFIRYTKKDRELLIQFLESL